MMSGANGTGQSNPLAPLPPHQDNFTPPRVARASTFDYATENHHLVGYGGGGGRGGRGAGMPPIPPKVPLALPPPPGPGPVMSGALQLHSSSIARRGGMDDGYDGYSGGGRQSGGGSWSLEEEMQRIDIGTGRSRRHERY
jgi:hypothetical protein